MRSCLNGKPKYSLVIHEAPTVPGRAQPYSHGRAEGGREDRKTLGESSEESTSYPSF